MGKLKIVTKCKTNQTVSRTIRMSGSTFDEINRLAGKYNISFNNLANQLLLYGIENLED